MLSPAIHHGRMSSDVPWAADNGRFSNPAVYSNEKFLAWLTRMAPYRDRCLFATAPDVVGDAAATLELSRPMFSAIRAAGYRPALVAQDGLEFLDIPWDEFDALFIGGSTAWKLSEASHSIAAEAKRRGKWLHMGRVNGIKRMRVAASIGCDSVDGTFLKFGPDTNMPRLQKWLDDLNSLPMLWDDHERKGYRPAKEET